MKNPTASPAADGPERKQISISQRKISAENIFPSSIPTNRISTGTISPQLVKVKPSLRERLIGLAAALTFLIMLAIFLGALTWVAVKIWVDVLSSI